MKWLRWRRCFVLGETTGVEYDCGLRRARVMIVHFGAPHERLVVPLPCAARAAMALAALSGDEQRILFTQLCNVLDPASPWP